MRKTQCLNCFKVIELEEDIKIQEIVQCPHCKVLLEVVRKFPLTLDWGEDPSPKKARRTLLRR
jgi:hypothetical protein